MPKTPIKEAIPGEFRCPPSTVTFFNHDLHFTHVDVGICRILQQPNNYMMLFTNGRNKAF